MHSGIALSHVQCNELGVGRGVGTDRNKYYNNCADAEAAEVLTAHNNAPGQADRPRFLQYAER